MLHLREDHTAIQRRYNLHSKTEVDAIASALEMGTVANLVSDMRIDVRQLAATGATKTLSLSTRKNGNADARMLLGL